MEIIDERTKSAMATRFGDLKIGEAFQIHQEDTIYIKTNYNTAMSWRKHGWLPGFPLANDDLIIPLEVIYKIRKEN